MKLIKTLMIAGIASTFAGTVLAQTTVPNTFSAGTAASASQVNDNFTAVTDAINNLAARVGVLEAASSITLNDLVGRTYCITSIGTISGVGATNFARHSTYVSKATMMITSTTQASLTGVSDDEHELDLSVDGSGLLTGTISEFHSPNSTTPITINGLTDGVLSTSIGDLFLAKDGSVLLNTDFSYSTSEGESSMAVGTLCK
ncbi:hypothetical protein MSNKSG1_14257 [Marinobacter santoriniensis NKSG1]|uniref:Lipoprotein n=1 Tax=Marinobacter santoriniensis NKSG1 TaxID=1288826 RepID=M7CMN9_9GAMM|nr:hypothetical protein [Marinobacter santoriniensis]EMP54901.1 hypothetical protein MSNKSG1_14257 [Marinobacter santoriniensis NKSG1]